MKTFLVILCTLLLVFVCVFLVCLGLANASTLNNPSVYDVDKTITNIYTGDDLLYYVSGLDTNTTYTFSLYLTDYETGKEKIRLLDRKQTIGSATLYLIFWNVNPAIMFPATIAEQTGPLFVEDQYGQVIGRNFVTARPNDDWFDTALQDNEYKTGIAGVVYNNFNDEGLQHDYYLPQTITTEYGDITLLHYQTPQGIESDDYIVISETTSGATSTATFLVNELHLYNFGAGTTPAPDCISQYGRSFASYVVLNTLGDNYLTYIDHDQESYAFTDSDYDNPFTTTILPGVYEYARFDSVTSAVVQYGESVWIVTSVKPDCDSYFIALSDYDYSTVTSNCQKEWDVSVIDIVKENRTQVATVTSFNADVWNDYPIQYLLDNDVGVIDVDSYDYQRVRTFKYSVENAIENNYVIYIRLASTMPLNPYYNAYFEFVMISNYYDVVESVGMGFQEELTDFFDRTAANNPDSLKLIALLGSCLVSAFVLGLLRVKQPLAYYMIMIGFSGIFLMFAHATLWVNILIGGIVGGVLLITNIHRMKPSTENE